MLSYDFFNWANDGYSRRFATDLEKKKAVVMFSPPLPGTSGPVCRKDSIAWEVFVSELVTHDLVIVT